MTLTLSLSVPVEARLRALAAASGTDVAQYAAELVERAVAAPQNGKSISEEQEEQRRLHLALSGLIQNAEAVTLPQDISQLKGRKAEYEQAIVEKFKKQGLGL